MRGGRRPIYASQKEVRSFVVSKGSCEGVLGKTIYVIGDCTDLGLGLWALGLDGNCVRVWDLGFD